MREVESAMAEVFSGRIITDGDMELIRWAREAYPNLSRYELAGTVCELIGWLTPAGGAKVPQCIAFFAKMEAEGKLDLPVLKTRNPSIRKARPANSATHSAHMPEITECAGIELCLARPGADMQKWRGRMDRHHKADLSKKAIYAYPLRPDFADILKGIKEFKTNPTQ